MNLALTIRLPCCKDSDPKRGLGLSEGHSQRFLSQQTPDLRLTRSYHDARHFNNGSVR